MSRQASSGPGNHLCVPPRGCAAPDICRHSHDSLQGAHRPEPLSLILLRSGNESCCCWPSRTLTSDPLFVNPVGVVYHRNCQWASVLLIKEPGWELLRQATVKISTILSSPCFTFCLGPAVDSPGIQFLQIKCKSHLLRPAYWQKERWFLWE